VLLVVWNIIVITVLDCDRSIRHFCIGDDDYVGDSSGGIGYDDDCDYDDDDACLGTKFDSSLSMEEVIGTNRLQTRTLSWMFAENEKREKWEQCLSYEYKFWFHIDCTEHDGGISFEMFNSLILCKT